MSCEEKGCDTLFYPYPSLLPLSLLQEDISTRTPVFVTPQNQHVHTEIRSSKCLQLVGARCLSVLEKVKCRPLLIRLVLIPTFESLQAPRKEQSDGSVFF